MDSVRAHSRFDLARGQVLLRFESANAGPDEAWVAALVQNRQDEHALAARNVNHYLGKAPKERPARLSMDTDISERLVGNACERARCLLQEF
jgi:hypothetical protein